MIFITRIGVKFLVSFAAWATLFAWSRVSIADNIGKGLGNLGNHAAVCGYRYVLQAGL